MLSLVSSKISFTAWKYSQKIKILRNFENQEVWQACLARNSEIPPNAVVGGKAHSRHTSADASSDDEEVVSNIYQILTHPKQDELKSIPTQGNHVLTGTLQAGGDYWSSLFIGRVLFEGGVCCGKFALTCWCVSIPWGGKEHAIQSDIEVLCLGCIQEEEEEQ